MASSTESSDPSGARTLLTADELARALAVEVYDAEGKTTKLGGLVQGRRSLLVFIRHFWCLNCQAYTRYISTAIPPSTLPTNTQILIIGNGSSPPIKTYASTTASAYPIYTDPSLQLHSILGFKSNLTEGNESEKRDYMRDAGSTVQRIWGGIKGALGNLGQVGSIGPKGLNGGEVLVSAEGQCEYMYRMQNTVDHTNVSELAVLLGVEMVVSGEEGDMKQGCGEACAVGGK